MGAIQRTVSHPAVDGKVARTQKWFLAFGAAGIAGAYFIYKAYRSDSLTALIELRERLVKCLDSYSRTALTASECSSKIVQDLQDFLASDSDEIPQSLKQLAKLAGSKEVSEATRKIAAAALHGLSGDGREAGEATEHNGATPQTVVERILNALSSERGASLVSLAVRMACRSAVEAAYEFGGKNADAQNPGVWQQLLTFGTTPQGEKLYNSCISTFVREGTKVYMGSMEGVNPWEDFLGSLCKADRQAAVDRITRVFVNELVVSFLKRTRHSLRSDPKTSKGVAKLGMQAPPARHASSHSLPTEAGENGYVVTIQPREAVPKKASEDGMLPDNQTGASAPPPDWAAVLIEASRHPELRSLILSVAGTATSEGVRTSLSLARDMLFGSPNRNTDTSVLTQGQQGDVAVSQLSSRTLGTLLLVVFMPVILFLAGRRVALG